MRHIPSLVKKLVLSSVGQARAHLATYLSHGLWVIPGELLGHFQGKLRRCVRLLGAMKIRGQRRHRRIRGHGSIGQGVSETIRGSVEAKCRAWGLSRLNFVSWIFSYLLCDIGLLI